MSISSWFSSWWSVSEEPVSSEPEPELEPEPEPVEQVHPSNAVVITEDDNPMESETETYTPRASPAKTFAPIVNGRTDADLSQHLDESFALVRAPKKHKKVHESVDVNPSSAWSSSTSLADYIKTVRGLAATAKDKKFLTQWKASCRSKIEHFERSLGVFLQAHGMTLVFRDPPMHSVQAWNACLAAGSAPGLVVYVASNTAEAKCIFRDNGFATRPDLRALLQTTPQPTLVEAACAMEQMAPGQQAILCLRVLRTKRGSPTEVNLIPLFQLERMQQQQQDHTLEIKKQEHKELRGKQVHQRRKRKRNQIEATMTQQAE